MPVRRPFPFRDPLPASVHLPVGKGRSPSERIDHVRAAYDSWKQRYLAQTAEGEYRVRFSAEPDSKTVSEGQGYGLLIAAYMAGADPDARAIFDGLYRFSRHYPSVNDPALMRWEILFDGPMKPQDDSAFDGDADIAYALLLAERQWGDEPGSIIYRDEARRIIRRMAVSTLGRNSHLPLLGDWVGSGEDKRKYNQWAWRSSDFMPAHFRAYAKATGDSVWRETVRVCYAHFVELQTLYSPKAGLVPDFIVSQPPNAAKPTPAPADFLEGEHDGDYFYNACRVPWRVGMDVLHNNAPEAREFLARLMRWANGAITNGKVPFAPGYGLDGTPIRPPEKQYFSAAFVAPLAVGAATGDAPQDIVNLLYDAIYAVRADYYEDTIGLLCLIALSGAAWNPLRT